MKKLSIRLTLVAILALSALAAASNQLIDGNPPPDCPPAGVCNPIQ